MQMKLKIVTKYASYAIAGLSENQLTYFRAISEYFGLKMTQKDELVNICSISCSLFAHSFGFATNSNIGYILCHVRVQLKQFWDVSVHLTISAAVKTKLNGKSNNLKT